MKLVFVLDKPLKQDSVMPRDIRNLVGALVTDEAAKDKLMNKDKTGNSQSKFVYSKPRPKSFDVLNYTDDIKEMVALENALVGETISINGNSSKIKECLWKEDGYEYPRKELTMYKTRTPVIVSINPVEHKMAYFCQHYKDNSKLEELLKRRIEGITKLQVKEFFGNELFFEDLEIKILDWKMRTITPDKEKRAKEYHQGLYVEFVSNYTLPRFIGYQSGLGYGEILNTNFGNKKYTKKEGK